jgi:hypothetical protein
MLSSFQFELVLSSDPWKANGLGLWLLALGSWWKSGIYGRAKLPL